MVELSENMVRRITTRYLASRNCSGSVGSSNSCVSNGSN